MRLSDGSGVFGIGRRVACLSLLLTGMALGCASPGPPHAPSLYLPKIAGDLTARRAGDRVELRFTAPMRTSDNLPLTKAMRVVVCRQVEHSACLVVPALEREVAPSKVGVPNLVTLGDVLPAEMTQGPPRQLAYRVELENAAGQSAGKSEAAYSAAGAAPTVVEGLRVEGSRLGVVLTWRAAEASDAVVLEREGGVKTERLASNGVDRTLDAEAKPEVAYRYTAVRERTVQMGGRSVVIRSAASAAVPFTLRLVYPPLPPTGLTVAGFATADPAGFAVDLVWQPVDDTGLLAGLAGYNVYREANGRRERLNAAPVQVPAFHDATAAAGVRYQYSVTAVDAKGNESGAVTARVD